MCNVVSDVKLPNEGGNGPLKLLEEISRFTSPVSESNASGNFPSRWLPFSDMAVRLRRFDNDIGMLPVSWLSERKKFCSVAGRSSGIVPPILLLLRFISVIDVNFPRLPSCPPKFAALKTIEVILEPVHVTPCQLSPQGSPPLADHPGSFGDSSAT